MAKLFFILTLSLALPIILVNSQDQSDFISIDCGASSDYTDQITGINYTSDSNFTQSGKSESISQDLDKNSFARQYWNVRSFAEGKRNCYKLKPPKGKDQRYLIRASFMYGNYDELGRFPEFDLYLGVNKWKTVRIVDLNVTESEIIHVPRRDYVDICLVKTRSATPFISALELRFLDNNTYVAQSGSLELFTRQNCGAQFNQFVRYSDDVFDRIWKPFNSNNLNVISTTSPIVSNSLKQPSVVMSTAVTPQDTNGIIAFDFISDPVDDEIPEHYLYLHFSELQNLTNPNQIRQLNIYLNGSLWFGPLVPNFLTATTVYSPSSVRGISLNVLINGTENSTLPPLLNAFEIYTVKNLPVLETNQEDVEAISNVKLRYRVKKNSWQGDPCAPKDYKWSGLDCSYEENDAPRIISLNLSSNGLSREISPFIAQLRMLKYLDLSNNNLSGTIPEILSDLSNLTVLNLKRNKLRGPIPRVLLERSRNGQLLLSVDPELTESETSPAPSSPSLPTNEDSLPTPNISTSSSGHNSLEMSKLAVLLLASIGLYLKFFNGLL